MGTYINKGNFAFQGTRNRECVDKSELIAIVNQTLFTRQRFSCVSRCRRFGKSMAAEMLCAYYDKSCDSRHLFEDLKIASHPSFEQHLNKYHSTQSAMNNFQEYSMVEPRSMAPYFGFTKDEAKSLAEKHGMDFSELEKWCDGYQIGDDQHIFNPNSVMQAIDTRIWDTSLTTGVRTNATYPTTKWQAKWSMLSGKTTGRRCIMPSRNRQFCSKQHCVATS